MSVKFVLKLFLALGAAVLLPVGYALQKDHYSGATRSHWSWAGLAVTNWHVEENARYRWVCDVLNLPPDYFDGIIGGPIWLAGHIGALPGKFREVELFREIWETASEKDKPLVRIEAVLCLMEPDWRKREQMMDEAKRWRRA